MLQRTSASFAKLLINSNRPTWSRIAEDWNLYVPLAKPQISGKFNVCKRVATSRAYSVVGDLTCTIHQVQQDKQVQLALFYSYK
jgi:hypothetical protein